MKILKVLRDPEIESLHETHPGSWRSHWQPRKWHPASKWQQHKQCIEANEEIQNDFGDLIIYSQGAEVGFLACIDRNSKFPSAEAI